ncbi:hypothetical protein H4R35_001760 [Dimargaris xerosporica]|nr:hypothetical protein H4R35_001760 [Dimargaris xerosporica]
MQLLSIQSLLVLSVLALPASLPGMEASNAVSTGHLLHRRVIGQFQGSPVGPSDDNGQSASLATASIEDLQQYGFESDIEGQIMAGVLRHKQEDMFLTILEAIIIGNFKMNRDNQHLWKFYDICSAALKAVRKNPTGIQQYNRLYARALYVVFKNNVHSASVQAELDQLAKEFYEIFVPHQVLEDVAKAITDKFLVKTDKTESQIELYNFLCKYVFGNKLDFDVYKQRYKLLYEPNSFRDGRFMNSLIETLGYSYYVKEIKDALKTVDNAPSANG